MSKGGTCYRFLCVSTTSLEEANQRRDPTRLGDSYLIVGAACKRPKGAGDLTMDLRVTFEQLDQWWYAAHLCNCNLVVCMLKSH